jgi:CubicO group peptidase (beta-lactamase class C family)
MRIPPLPQVPAPLPDPLRRIRVPDDLESLMTFGPEEGPGALGADAVERIWRGAVAVYRTGVHPAVQVCVRHEGAIVLNRAIGHARGNGPDDRRGGPIPIPATPDTPIVIYSGAKALTATVIHLLAERGELALSDPVAAYIPGYDRHGKGSITIGQVLSHRAGVPSLVKEALDLDRAADRDFVVQTLIDAKPFARAGRFLAYHAVSGGFILGEIVHRICGVDIREVLAREIQRPLGLRWTNYGVDEADLDTVALNYVTGPPAAPPLSQLFSRALGLSVDKLVESSNDPRFLRAIVPSANIVTTAYELSGFYEMLRRGGELDGTRVLQPATIRNALRQQSHLEVDLSLGFPTRFSYGYMLGARLLSLYGRDTQHAFGHLGFTNILAWADPERALSAAVLTTGKPTLYPGIERFYGLTDRITRTMPKVPGEQMAVWDPQAGRPRSGP